MPYMFVNLSELGKTLDLDAKPRALPKVSSPPNADTRVHCARLLLSANTYTLVYCRRFHTTPWMSRFVFEEGRADDLLHWMSTAYDGTAGFLEDIHFTCDSWLNRFCQEASDQS